MSSSNSSDDSISYLTGAFTLLAKAVALQGQQIQELKQRVDQQDQRLARQEELLSGVAAATARAMPYQEKGVFLDKLGDCVGNRAKLAQMVGYTEAHIRRLQNGYETRVNKKK